MKKTYFFLITVLSVLSIAGATSIDSKIQENYKTGLPYLQIRFYDSICSGNSTFTSVLVSTDQSTLFSEDDLYPYCAPPQTQTDCVQTAEHWTYGCGSGGCGVEQQLHHHCWRCCHPNGTCDGWQSTNLGCVTTDCYQMDTCNGCSGYCYSLTNSSYPVLP